MRRGEGGGGGIVGSFILLYTFSDHSHNYKVIYIVHRFMCVHYVFILKYRDVVVTHVINKVVGVSHKMTSCD